MTTPRLGVPELTEGQAAPETGVNEMVRYLEQGAGFFTIVDRDLTTPPGSPVDGDAYIVAGTGAGGWVGHDGDIAFRMSSSWEFINVAEGMGFWIEDENKFLIATGTSTFQEFRAVSVLDDLSDVDAAAPADGDTIVWVDAENEWQSAPLPGGGGGGGTVPDGGSTGQVLTKASGVDQDTEWDTPNIYEAGPPTAPAAASFTWFNQGSSTATDGTDCLLLGLAADASALIRAKYDTAPSAPYSVYMRAEDLVLSAAGATTSEVTGYGIILRDGVNGDSICCGHFWQRVSGDEQNLYALDLNHWSAVPALATAVWSRFGSRPVPWLRVDVTSTEITFYASRDGKNWIQAGPTETIATRVGAVTQIGFFGRTVNPATIFIPYFSTTAPA